MSLSVHVVKKALALDWFVHKYARIRSYTQ